MLSEQRDAGADSTHSLFKDVVALRRKNQEFFSCKNVCVRPCFVCFPCFCFTHFSPLATAHKQYSRLIWTWKQHFQLMYPHPWRLIPSGKMKENSKPWPSVSVCFSSYPACLTLSISFYFCPFCLFLLVQIQDFSSGFWDGTKLACWMKGETPWRFFPKLSIYLRATNSSQSFRITILPQVPG